MGYCSAINIILLLFNHTEYDGYDDVYGHSVEDDYCVSPGTGKVLWAIWTILLLIYLKKKSGTGDPFQYDNESRIEFQSQHLFEKSYDCHY